VSKEQEIEILKFKLAKVNRFQSAFDYHKDKINNYPWNHLFVPVFHMYCLYSSKVLKIKDGSD